MSQHPATATFKEFAAIVGCAPSYVTDLRKTGRLVLSDAGKVRVSESLARIAATRDPAMHTVAERHAAERGAPLTGADPVAGQREDVPAEPTPGEDSPDFQRWKARRERAGALREEIRLGEETGELVRKADAVAVVAHAFTVVRSELEALPDSIAPVLAGESDEGRVRILLAEEIEHVLGNLASAIAKLGQKEAGP